MQMLLFLFLKEEDPQLFTKLFLALLGFFFFKFPRNLQKIKQTIKVSVIKSLFLFTKFQAEHIN